MRIESGAAPYWAHIAAWTVWLVSWSVAAAWQKRVAARPAIVRELPYRLLFLAGLFGLFYGLRGATGAPEFQQSLLARAYRLSDAAAWSSVAFPVAGFLFAWWARLHLGALWSSGVTRKEGHRVVDSGPYAIVRHPIYTGLLCGALGLLVIGASAASLAGFVLLTAGVILKARLEESFLVAELGHDAYDAYRRRTPMLIPFGPK